MSVSRPRTMALAALLALALTGPGCSNDTLAPFEPEITSATDNFQLQATGVRNRTTSVTYDWEVTGQRAKINHSTLTTAGSAWLTIRDPTGTVVYDARLVPSLSDTTNTGTSGTWQIVLRLDSYSGSLNFRAQKL